MAHNIPTWLMAGGLIASGLNWWQATAIIALGNLIVLVPIVLNSHPGAKYGIPFPVIARASFGIRGANIAALVRGLIAAVWFGIQVRIGAQALELVLERLAPSLAAWNKQTFAFQGLLDWVCFLAFLALNLSVLMHGMGALRRFERWAAPAIMVLALILWGWAWSAAGGLGPVISAPPQHASSDMFDLVVKSLMSVIGFWATLSLNASDFTRFSRSQRDQVIGQALGMPTTMFVFSLLGVLTTSATAVIFGKVIWDALELVKLLPSTILVVICLLAIVLATLSVNVPANLVSASYDISNLSPKRISFWRGACIAAAVGTVILPWRLISDPHIYIFDWLGICSIALAPIAGILIADYWWVRGKVLAVEDLYHMGGIYTYSNGFNPKAIVAFALGVLCAYSGNLVPALHLLTDMGWITGFFVAMLSYRALMGRQETAS
jgi:NCS1 family nucleobase:cation symporter-1